MIETAVILAAGKGSRLGEITKHMPKGFIQLDDSPLIEHSIKKLLSCGIKVILIGTGYLSDVYENLAKSYPQITCVRIDNYCSTGSMYTLYKLKDFVKEDFLLLESDLLYEKRALETLLAHDSANVILASQFTAANDEVLIAADLQKHLIRMDKNRATLNNIYGEFTGLSKISLQCYRYICEYAQKALTLNEALDYEEAINNAANKLMFFVKKIDGLGWCEIDTPEHLKRAKEIVYPLVKARERTAEPVIRNILLNPGPATTTDTVKYAQVVADICPREKDFGQEMSYVSSELTNLAADNKDYTTVLFGGSGTAAVEAVLSSVIPEKHLLVINNGTYSKRMSEIANAYGIKLIEFHSPSDLPIDLKKLEETILGSKKEISHIAVVHHETTTGLLTDIASIGQLCKNYGIELIVDAISSFGAVPINLREMNISYLAASSNKNLQGMPGIAYVIAKKSSLEQCAYLKPKNLYLNLYQQYKYFEMKQQMRFTPPVQTIYALKQAILETLYEGIEARYQRYIKSWQTLTEGLKALGLSYLVDDKHHSKLVTAIKEPQSQSYDFNKMHNFFYKQGITIYPGKLNNNKTFRVANIGDITYKDMKRFLKLLQEYLNLIDFKIPV